METVIDEFSCYFWKALSVPASMLGIRGNEWVLGVGGDGVHGVAGPSEAPQGWGGCAARSEQ